MPPSRAWQLIRDVDAWIRLLEGYDGHTVEGGGAILLQLRGEVRFMTKVARLRIEVTEEWPPAELAFSMTGTTDPLAGGGRLRIVPLGDDACEVSYELSLDAGGIAAPVLNAFLEKVVPRAVGDLAARLADHLTAPGEAVPA